MLGKFPQAILLMSQLTLKTRTGDDQYWIKTVIQGEFDMIKHKCVCCGNYTINEEPPGTFEICPVCFWEDDNVQFDNPDKKRLIFNSIIGIFLILTLLSGCIENKKIKDDSNTGMIDNRANLISYCAKEKTQENRIYFNYPQFMETVTNANTLNELIEANVTDALYELCGEDFKGNFKDSPENLNWKNEDYIYHAIDIDYKIMRNDLDYFSVIFTGLCNYKTAAHPIHYFSSLSIDVNKCEIVTLSDLYVVDSDFTNTVIDIFKDQIKEGLTEQTGTLLEDIPVFVETVMGAC